MLNTYGVESTQICIKLVSRYFCTVIYNFINNTEFVVLLIVLKTVLPQTRIHALQKISRYIFMKIIMSRRSNLHNLSIRKIIFFFINPIQSSFVTCNCVDNLRPVWRDKHVTWSLNLIFLCLRYLQKYLCINSFYSIFATNFDHLLNWASIRRVLPCLLRR